MTTAVSLSEITYPEASILFECAEKLVDECSEQSYRVTRDKVFNLMWDSAYQLFRHGLSTIVDRLDDLEFLLRNKKACQIESIGIRNLICSIFSVALKRYKSDPKRKFVRPYRLAYDLAINHKIDELQRHIIQYKLDINHPFANQTLWQMVQGRIFCKFSDPQNQDKCIRNLMLRAGTNFDIDHQVVKLLSIEKSKDFFTRKHLQWLINSGLNLNRLDLSIHQDIPIFLYQSIIHNREDLVRCLFFNKIRILYKDALILLNIPSSGSTKEAMLKVIDKSLEIRKEAEEEHTLDYLSRLRLAIPTVPKDLLPMIAGYCFDEKKVLEICIRKEEVEQKNS